MKAMIGMSGGVDSSVAAYLMQQAGFECLGATMALYTGQDGAPCTSDAATDAHNVCQRLGMDFRILDASDSFQRLVMDHFTESYQKGLTPNPCIACNRHLKFGYFLQCAKDFGCEYIVTGHYARIHNLPNGRFCLQKAVDTDKDQSYFLYTMTQDQLAHTQFPLGGLTKMQVREIAQEQGFLNARKRDSQDICFVPDGDYLAFLQRYTGETAQPGDFLDQTGKVVGRHRGAVGYTCGQRKGLGLAMGAPVYVCSKDMAANTVTIGPNEALFRRNLLANDWNWMAIEAPISPIRCKAKVRSRMIEQNATVYPAANGEYRVCFDAPQRAITTGQAVVLYDGDLVLGGGTITAVCQQEDRQ